MEYTQKDFEEDKRISNLIFNKYFKKSYRFKDDLIQESLMKLWKGRAKFDEKKCKYSTWAFKVSLTSMFMFLRKEKKHFYNLSLDYEIKGIDDDEMRFVDTIGVNKIDIDEIDFKTEFSKVFKKKNEEIKKIIDMYFKGYTRKEIAKEIDKNQITVSRKLSKFGNELKAEMAR